MRERRSGRTRLPENQYSWGPPPLLSYEFHTHVMVADYNPAGLNFRTTLRCAVNAAEIMTVVRCPYCVSGDQFRPMTADGRGRYVCAKCGHLAMPADKGFECHCGKCDELRQLDLRRSRYAGSGQESRPSYRFAS
jgi:hypothetical protein